MLVINNFSNLNARNLHWLNSANIALIPKKDGAEDISDFRPISLIHAVAKLIAKILATRLAPHMNDIVSTAQSAFIKKRSTHDNFMYVRNLSRKFHGAKKPMLLFKLDIKKAFDSVRWDYLLEVLNHHGFPTRFRDWVSTLLSSTSSRVLLNGIAGDPIKHGQGLRQGDPFSPLLFVLAIDPLHHILSKATTKESYIPCPRDNRGEFVPRSMLTTLPFSVPPLRRMSNALPTYFPPLVNLLASPQTAPKVLWYPSDVPMWTLMMFSSLSRLAAPPSRSAILGSPSRSKD